MQAGRDNNLNFLPDPGSRIFLLGHMRAFTSLAGHILGSHPQINGYYEMHVSYEDAQAPARQLALYRENDEIKPGSRYLFDKLLHNDYRLRPECLGTGDVTILITLREPEPTIRSIVSLFAGKDEDDPYAAPQGATQYYVERLAALAGFCRTAGHDYYYYDAALLKDRPGELLPRLSDWLELDTPLSERYSIFSLTGREHLGDSSAAIRRGRIDKTPRDYPDVRIPGDLLERARRVYRDCRVRIIQGAVDSAQERPAGSIHI